MFLIITKQATGRQLNWVWQGPKIWVIIVKECSLLEMVLFSKLKILVKE